MSWYTRENMNKSNWYERAKQLPETIYFNDIGIRYSEAKELLKEAGWKENIATSLMAALLMILSGGTIQNASKKNNVPEETITRAMQNNSLMEEAKRIQGKLQIPSGQVQDPTEKKYDSSMPSTNEILEFIKRNEGYSRKAYKDTMGKMTIGVGFNLDKPSSRKAIESMGLNYDDVRNKGKALTDSQINKLFIDEVNVAVKDARVFVNNFDLLAKDVKMILIDMSYNMGLSKLSTFVKFKEALERKDFNKAAKEMKNSKWYSHVKSRGVRLVNMMSNIASPAMMFNAKRPSKKLI